MTEQLKIITQSTWNTVPPSMVVYWRGAEARADDLHRLLDALPCRSSGTKIKCTDLITSIRKGHQTAFEFVDLISDGGEQSCQMDRDIYSALIERMLDPVVDGLDRLGERYRFLTGDEVDYADSVAWNMVFGVAHDLVGLRSASTFDFTCSVTELSCRIFKLVSSADFVASALEEVGSWGKASMGRRRCNVEAYVPRALFDRCAALWSKSSEWPWNAYWIGHGALRRVPSKAGHDIGLLADRATVALALISAPYGEDLISLDHVETWTSQLSAGLHLGMRRLWGNAGLTGRHNLKTLPLELRWLRSLLSNTDMDLSDMNTHGFPSHLAEERSLVRLRLLRLIAGIQFVASELESCASIESCENDDEGYAHHL